MKSQAKLVSRSLMPSDSEDVSHPFPFISELSNIKKIESFQDLIDINNFVFSFVPWIKKEERLPNSTDVQTLYFELQQKRAGGWCGLNAKFMERILKGYLVPCYLYKYGLYLQQFTHAVVIVYFNKNWFLLDPYFAKYYVTPDGEPIVFGDFLRAIKQRNYMKYKAVINDKIHKLVNTDFWESGKDEAGKDVWVRLKSKAFQNHIIKIWNDLAFKQLMKEEFGHRWKLDQLVAKFIPDPRLIVCEVNKNPPPKGAEYMFEVF